MLPCHFPASICIASTSTPAGCRDLSFLLISKISRVALMNRTGFPTQKHYDFFMLRCIQSLQTQAQTSSRQPRAQDAAWAAELSRTDLNTLSTLEQAQRRQPRPSSFHTAVVLWAHAAARPALSSAKESTQITAEHVYQPSWAPSQPCTADTENLLFSCFSVSRSKSC